MKSFFSKTVTLKPALARRAAAATPPTPAPGEDRYGCESHIRLDSRKTRRTYLRRWRSSGLASCPSLRPESCTEYHHMLLVQGEKINSVERALTDVQPKPDDVRVP